ncbi:class F sortase [Salinispora cortesiana]|uniref:class F sortase n=1 Tax=Salinispora cortesiana TaxID=1305843 RepID=UPI000413E7C0|nr:class F sortase [Salinispora cortesiana]
MVPWSEGTTTRAGGRHGLPWRAAGPVVVVLLALAGFGLIGASFTESPSARPPQPPALADSPVGAAATGPDAARPAPSGRPRSAPNQIVIPKIGVDASIMKIGTNPDGTVEVPPLDQAQLAGWYEPGASPGEVGNAVIVGHVDSAELGPAVFFSLGELRPGDTVGVAREDGEQVDFTVESVKTYPKNDFPAELVYGSTDQIGLRVVTCGGVFDEAAGSYPDNIVVFATQAQ